MPKTLKELGEEYMRQAELLEEKVVELENAIRKDKRKGIVDCDKIDQLHKYRDIVTELRITAYKLINYYEER